VTSHRISFVHFALPGDKTCPIRILVCQEVTSDKICPQAPCKGQYFSDAKLEASVADDSYSLYLLYINSAYSLELNKICKIGFPLSHLKATVMIISCMKCRILPEDFFTSPVIGDISAMSHERFCSEDLNRPCRTFLCFPSDTGFYFPNIRKAPPGCKPLVAGVKIHLLQPSVTGNIARRA
jgi:hypothetical protein